MTLGVLIFVFTYLVISAGRLGRLGLDRPAGALVGAVLCVAAGVLAPDRAIAAVDARTLVLLFGMMGMGAFLALDGFFERAGRALAARTGTPARLLGAVVWSSGALSALITNDAVCVLAAPLLVELVRRYRLPPLPFLLALATSANTGSVATLVGNPQNMLCASLGDLSYRQHFLLMAPVALTALAINHVLLLVLFRRQLGGRFAVEPAASVFTGKSAVVLGVIGAVAGLFLAGADLAWTSVGGCALLLFLVRTDPAEVWRRIDWSILLFFCGLFVVVEGFVTSGAPAWFFARVPLGDVDGAGSAMRLAGSFLLGSNVVSNVPFILVVRDHMATLADPRLGWEMLAMASTFAGNLTLLGSVANIIVAERGREVGELGFWPYFRVGFPLAMITTLVGTLWLVAIG